MPLVGAVIAAHSGVASAAGLIAGAVGVATSAVLNPQKTGDMPSEMEALKTVDRAELASVLSKHLGVAAVPELASIDIGAKLAARSKIDASAARSVMEAPKPKG